MSCSRPSTPTVAQNCALPSTFALRASSVYTGSGRSTAIGAVACVDASADSHGFGVTGIAVCAACVVAALTISFGAAGLLSIARWFCLLVIVYVIASTSFE